jgi:hypothetical protein
MAYYSTPYYGYYPTVQPIPVQQPMGYPQQIIEQSQPIQQQMLPTQMSGTSQNLNVQSEQPSDSYIVWVQGKAGAQSYPVRRGTTLPLFDSEGDYLYIKSVDSNGVPLPLVTKVISDPPVEVKEDSSESISQVDMSGYVTKESYEELKKKYEELELRIMDIETKPSYTSNFTGNTFNNTRKDGEDNGSKFTI